MLQFGIKENKKGTGGAVGGGNRGYRWNRVKSILLFFARAGFLTVYLFF
jgi:hypothetical protein